jgi:signal transduction histidine kinase
VLGVDGACIVSYGGHLIGEVEFPPAHVEEVRQRLVRSFEQGLDGYFEIRYKDDIRQLVGFSPLPLTRALQPIGRSDAICYVFVGRDLQRLATDFRSHLTRNLMGGAALIVFLAFIAYSVARRLTRPVQKLETGVRRLAEGDLDSRVDLATGDELESLASAFNEMAQRIQQTTLDLQKQMTTVRRQADEIALVSEVSRAINARLDLGQTLTTFARETARLIAYDHLSVALLDEDGEHFTVQFVFPEGGPSEFAPGTRHDIEESDIGEAIRDGRPRVKRNLGAAPDRALDDFLASGGFRSLMVVPLISESKAIGSVNLAGRNPEAFGPEDEKRMAVLAEPVAVAIQHSHLYMRVRRFAEELEDEVRRRTTQLRRAQDKLVQTEKLAASGQLAAGVAHEINNPLGIIKNYLRLSMDQLRQAPDSDPATHLMQNLQVMEEEISRIARIVRNLLDIYHPRDDTPGPTDVNFVIERVLELFAHKWRKSGIEVETKFEVLLPAVNVSSDRLRQVLINLFRNAEDAVGENGHVGVTTRLQNKSGDSEPDWLVIEVEDSGCGIAKKDLARVFDPFFTTKKGGGGTGLGLSVTYGIVRSFGGTIDIDSRRGSGARVSVSIPIAAAEDAADETEPSPPAAEVKGATGPSPGK